MTPGARHTMLALLAAGTVAADDAERDAPPVSEELTDMEFLEYLGSWEESDADWLIFSVPEADSPTTESPPARDEEDERES